MEIQEYIKQRKRMMNSIGRAINYCTGVNCTDCHILTGTDCFSREENNNPRRAEEIVRRWADEHPLVTNLDKFSEVMYNYFEVTVDKTKNRVVCPPHNRYTTCEQSCSACKEWWNKEYKEPPKKEAE